MKGGIRFVCPEGHVYDGPVGLNRPCPVCGRGGGHPYMSVLADQQRQEYESVDEPDPFSIPGTIASIETVSEVVESLTPDPDTGSGFSGFDGGDSGGGGASGDFS